MKQTKIIEHTKIKMPFRADMALASLMHKKGCTSRNEKYGSVGDQFDIVLDMKDVIEMKVIDGPAGFKSYQELQEAKMSGTFELYKVERLPLSFVAEHLFWLEGFPSTEAFIAGWDELHQRLLYEDEPGKLVWTHFYYRAGAHEVAVTETDAGYV